MAADTEGRISNTSDGYCRHVSNPCAVVAGCHNDGCRLERDLRWENVSAYIGPVQGYLYDEETDVRDWVEFLIEVIYNGTTWYSRQLIHKKDVDLNHRPILKFILDEMVSMVDEYMDGKRPVDG